MFEKYGSTALIIYLVLFVVTFAGAAIALQAGLSVDGAPATAGLLAGAWVVSKMLQPVRILATLALTPIVANVLSRRPRGQVPPT